MGWKFWRRGDSLANESSPLLQQPIEQQQVEGEGEGRTIPESVTPTLVEEPSTWNNFVVKLRNIHNKERSRYHGDKSHYERATGGDSYNDNDSCGGDEKEGFFNQDRKEYVKSKIKMVKRRLPYYVPILSWLPKYSKQNLVNDAVAGLTTGIMLVPQGMAYALLVGIPSIYGLYTGMFPILFYVIFGTSRQLGVGPEAAVSLIVGDTLRQISEANDIPLTTQEMVEQANILAFIVGIVSLALGLLRFGFLSEVLSRPLIRGFILAIAFTIMFDQLDTLLGLSGITGTSWEKIPDILDNLYQAHPLSYVMSICSILALLIMAQIKKRIPEKRTHILHHVAFFIPSILVVVVVGIAVSSGFKLYDKGLKVLGYTATSFPVPALPRLNQWDVVSSLIQPGLFISIVGFVESMAVSKNFATKHNYQVSTNRELVAIGVCNVMGSIFLAYPMFASMTRSAVNDRAGAKSQLAGFFTFLVILLTCLFLMPVFQYLPKVIMSSIVFVAALGLIEVHDIYFLWKIRAWRDLFLLAVTAVTTFVFNVEVGLIVSIGVSCFMVIKQSSAPHFTVLGRMPDNTFYQQDDSSRGGNNNNNKQSSYQPPKYKDILIFTEAKQIDGIIIIRVEESLYFSNIGQVKDILFRIENMGSASSHPSELRENNDPLRGVVLDMRNIPVADASSLQTLHEVVSSYRKRGVIVCFVKLREALKVTFLRAGFFDLVGVDCFFNSVHEAVQCIQSGNSKLRQSYSSYIGQPIGNHKLNYSSSSNPTVYQSSSSSFYQSPPNNYSNSNPFESTSSSSSSSSSTSLPITTNTTTTSTTTFSNPHSNSNSNHSIIPIPSTSPPSLDTNIPINEFLNNQDNDNNDNNNQL